MTAAIAAHELRRLFRSPLAWLALAVAMFVLGLVFLTLTDAYLSVIQPRMAARPEATGATDHIAVPLLLWSGVVLLGVIPLLGARSFAEERQRASLQLLLAAPLSAAQVVLGKFAALSLFLALAVALVALLPALLALGTTPDWGRIAAGLLGLYLLLASYAAAVLYVSALTRTPALAAVGGLGLLLFLAMLYAAGNSPAAPTDLLAHLSHFGHFQPFLDGRVRTEDLAYYGLFTVLFLTLTVRRFERLRALP